MADWVDSDDETTKKITTPVVVAPKPIKKANKWEGEDEDDDGPVVSLLPSPCLHAPHSQNPHTFAHFGLRNTLE